MSQGRSQRVSAGATSQVIKTTTKHVMTAVRSGSGQASSHGATVTNKKSTVG